MTSCINLGGKLFILRFGINFQMIIAIIIISKFKYNGNKMSERFTIPRNTPILTEKIPGNNIGIGNKSRKDNPYTKIITKKKIK